MTQCSRVLKLARRYKGVCQAELLGDTPDGGNTITRLAARVQDLEDQGHVFEHLHDRKGTRVYRLVSDPDVERSPVDGPLPSIPPSGAALGAGPERLFEPAPAPHFKEAA